VFPVLASQCVVLDGGLSTQLERRGATFHGSLWTGRALLENPEIVRQAHLDFVEAGAEIISTASYQLSRAGFVSEGMTAKDADRALIRSVEIAREAVAGTGVKVAASIGPWGATQHDGSEYRGNYGVDQDFLEDFHRARMKVLAEAQPDYWAVETIPEVSEARALASVLAEFSDIPAWVSFSCRDDAHVASGESIDDAVVALAGVPNVIAVGVNCVPPENVAGLARAIREVTDLPMIAYPNRGGIWDAATGDWEGQSPRALGDWLPQWRDAGVSMVGGCCGHGAAEISALKQTLSA
jgi:homocysteine S-methyltransferase